MTTITIERALLEKIIEKFAACGCEVCTRQSIEALKAALAAPATAPAWHVAPTVPGLWVCNYGALSVTAVNQPDIDAFDPAYNAGGRWFGPIPEDKK
jgi:hypothetical protein